MRKYPLRFRLARSWSVDDPRAKPFNINLGQWCDYLAQQFAGREAQTADCARRMFAGKPAPIRRARGSAPRLAAKEINYGD